MFAHFSPFEHVHTMKRRAEDPEPIFAPQHQPSRRPAVHGIAESLQHRALAPAPTVIEAPADNMQPSSGIQYSLPQGYQVWQCQWLGAVSLNAVLHFWYISSLKVATMPQSTSGHAHAAAQHVAPHAHGLALQSQGPTVVQGPVHPPAHVTQGQQQFQRLKVWT